tara:strand:+ start:659 stop:997 length:339 start_codon:yes stop_codon:yes gene_type:complete
MTEAEARTTIRRSAITYGVTVIFLWPPAVFLGTFLGDAPNPSLLIYALYDCILVYPLAVIGSVLAALFVAGRGNYARAASIATFGPWMPMVAFFVLIFGTYLGSTLRSIIMN